MKYQRITPDNTSLLGIMRNRLMIVAAVLMAAAPSSHASVITFDDPGDLARFSQSQQDFWSATSGAGLDGTTGLTGPNTGNNAWVTYSTGFDSKATSVSGGIYFKLIESGATGSGYSISFGVASSSSYTPNVSNVTPSDPSKNHYSAILQYSTKPTPPAERQFRVYAHQSKDGALEYTASDHRQSLDYDAWYFLSLEATFDPSTSLYSITASLYDSSVTGALGESIMSASLSNFTLPALTDADENYFFFGLAGSPATRGVAALDRFTYQAIPEPSMAILALACGFGLFAFRCFSMGSSRNK